MKTVARPQAELSRTAFQTLPPLFIEAAVLALHFALPQSSAWHEAVLVLLVIPVLLAALGGVRIAAPALALPAVALADDIAAGDAARSGIEAVFLATISVTGWLIARNVDAELLRGDRVLAETRRRRARLKSASGYWQSVALTRLGVYATSVEETFLDEALSGQPGGVVIDVGSASGRLEHVLTRYADHVLATDIDRDEVYAMADDPKVTPAVVSELPSLPVRSEAADAVVAIEAPAASDQAWYREECRRVLRPGGIAIVTLYNARSYRGLLMRLRRRVRREGAPRWGSLYYQRSLGQQLRLWREAGFEPHRMRGFYWPPLSRQSESRIVAAGAALERLLGLWRLAWASPCVLVELRRVD